VKPPAESFGITEISRLTGIGRETLRERIAAKVLPASKVPSAGRLGWRYEVSRPDLVSWLLSSDCAPATVRRLLNGGAGAAVALVRTRPSLQTAFLARRPTVLADSLFALRGVIDQWRVAAAVIDLPEVGSADATASLRAFSKLADRPELVGLYDDEYTPRPDTAAVFDLLLPLSRSDAALARAVTEFACEHRA
jgi:hypothetical protein